ncbi:hypothetical protein RUM43_006486 [Polyplax serrata]|uniref:Uncharacterized protein n=1 Tax=Polyplax serrata TaxID=468196 RepID=A0AAN8PCS1_POLSC
MPVFNDTAFYLSGGHNTFSSPYSPTTRSPYHGFPTTNFNYSNPKGSTGLIGGRYKPDIKKFNPTFGGRNTQLGGPYISNYTTYADWKENLIFNKMRDDTSYRWKEKYRLDNYYRANRPVFIDTSKIDVSRPRQKREEVSVPPVTVGNSTGKPIARDDEQKGTISRGRTVVRIHTKALKENPYFANQYQPKKGQNESDNKQSVKPMSNRKSKTRSLLRIKSGEEEQENSDDETNINKTSIKRDSTLKHKESVNDDMELDREDTLKNTDTSRKNVLQKGLGTIVRRCKIRKRSKDRRESVGSVTSTDDESRRNSLMIPQMNDKKRLSMELFEEQAAILDSLIKEEMAKKDADDYFSDPKRGTVKISAKQRLSKSQRDIICKKQDCAESSTTDDDLDASDSVKKTVKRRSRSSRSDDSEESSSGSRRSSLFQDLFIEATITENCQEEAVAVEESQKERCKTEQKPNKPIKKFLKSEVKPTSSEAKSTAEKSKKPKAPKLFVTDATEPHQLESPKTDDDNSNFLQKQDTVKKMPNKLEYVKKNTDSLFSKFKKSLKPGDTAKTKTNSNTCKSEDNSTIKGQDIETLNSTKGDSEKSSELKETVKTAEVKEENKTEENKKGTNAVVKPKGTNKIEKPNTNTVKPKEVQPTVPKWKLQFGKKTEVKQAKPETKELPKPDAKQTPEPNSKQEEKPEVTSVTTLHVKDPDSKKKKKEVDVNRQKAQKLKLLKKKRQKVVVLTFEKPEPKIPEISILPSPCQGVVSERQEKPKSEDESSVSETCSDATDLETEEDDDDDEEEDESDDSETDKLRPSYSNDSGFGSAYHKNRTGTLLI